MKDYIRLQRKQTDIEKRAPTSESEQKILNLYIKQSNTHLENKFLVRLSDNYVFKKLFKLINIERNMKVIIIIFILHVLQS